MTTDHTILANAGFAVRVGRTNPAVLDRIAAVNSRFCSTTNQHYIRINRRAKHIIKSLNKQVYQEGTRVPAKSGAKDFTHSTDALGYLVNWFWPVKREVEQDARHPQHWGHY
jgi:hypothetical protein